MAGSISRPGKCWTTNVILKLLKNPNRYFLIELITFDIRVGHLGGGSDFEGFSYVIGIPAADFGYMVRTSYKWLNKHAQN